MQNFINFQNENHNNTVREKWSDLDWINEFYEFLKGNSPEGIFVNGPKLSSRKAYSVIYYLQEHLRVLPDNIEKCYKCNDLFDINLEGDHSDETGQTLCGYCLID